MASEDEEYTDLINEGVLEDGVEGVRGLSDEDFHDLIQFQYKRSEGHRKSGFF